MRLTRTRSNRDIDELLFLVRAPLQSCRKRPEMCKGFTPCAFLFSIDGHRHAFFRSLSSPGALTIQSLQTSAKSALAVHCLGRYSGFDSALYRSHDAKWHFSQENATSYDFQMATSESKPL